MGKKFHARSCKKGINNEIEPICDENQPICDELVQGPGRVCSNTVQINKL
jgi:hypothetical protein